MEIFLAIIAIELLIIIFRMATKKDIEYLHGEFHNLKIAHDDKKIEKLVSSIEELGERIVPHEKYLRQLEDEDSQRELRIDREMDEYMNRKYKTKTDNEERNSKKMDS
jgi:hypothetical protein